MQMFHMHVALVSGTLMFFLLLLSGLPTDDKLVAHSFN